MKKSLSQKFDKKTTETKAFVYASKILDGSIISCKFIKQAAERFMKDLERDDLIFDTENIERVTMFMEKYLYVPELKAPVPLQLPHAFWIQQLFGFYYKDSGLRKYNSAYLQFARKSFKTFYAAAVAIIEMLFSNDNDPMIMQGANSRDQAIICTNMTGKIINASPQLRKYVDQKKIKLYSHKEKFNRITFGDGNRTCEIEAMPKDVGDGHGASVGIIDEFHEANSLALLETIKSGQGQRVEPLVLVITSAGHNKSGPCYTSLRKRSVDLLDGVIESDRHLAIVYELDDESEWDKIELLEKSNPMIPYSKTLVPYLKERVEEAKTSGAGEQMVNVKIKNSGIWVDAPKIWIPTETLKKNSHGITDEELKGKECFCGLDLSSGKDLNAFVMFFPNVRPEIHAVRSFFWIPDDKIANQSDDGVDYIKWVSEGFMSKFDGNVVEYYEIADHIADQIDQHETRVLGADAKYLYGGPTPKLRERGHEDLIRAIGQGFNLTAATEQVEIWASKHQLDLMDNPVLLWNFSNVTMHVGHSGHKYPSKGKSNGRIDGISALVTAVEAYLKVSLEDNSESFLIEV